MGRRSKAGGTPVKARRRKATPRTRRNARAAPRRGASSIAHHQGELVRLRRELSGVAEQQVATAEILRLIGSTSGDLQPVFANLLASAVRLCDAHNGVINRWDGNTLHLAATHNMPAAFIEVRKNSPYRLEENSATARLLARKGPIHIADLANDPAYLAGNPSTVAAVEIGGIRTALAVPLLKDNELVGSFTVGRQVVRPFTSKQIKIVQNFAAQAVVAVHNAQLLHQLQETLQQQAAAADVLKIISRSKYDLQAVLDTLIELVARQCGADLAAIHPERRYFRAYATYGGPNSHKEVAGGVALEPGQGSVMARTVREGRPVQVADVLADPDYTLHEAQQRLGYRTVLGVPLLREGRPVGVIVLMRSTVSPFTERQIELAQNFADQAVIAIENSRLLNQLRQSLEQQTASADILRVISSSLGDPKPVFQAMLESATRICNAAYGALYRYDGKFFHADALLNVPDAFAATIQSGPTLAAPDSGLGRVAQTKQTAHIADLRAERLYAEGDSLRRAAADLGGARTVLVVPMLKGEELLGAFVIFRQEVRPFTERQIALTTSFADQAVIAIENARLLNELRQRTLELGRSVAELERERNNKLMNLEAMVASISHEVRQPLASIASNGGAALRFLGHAPPNLEEVQSALNRMVGESHRASEVFDNIRALFGKTDRGREPIEVNELVRGVVSGLQGELEDNGITAGLDLSEDLPPIRGHKGQLQEVLINLVRNAIEAMHDDGEGPRLLKVSTLAQGETKLIVAVEDSGPGIDPGQSSNIFDAFMTTKSHGTGLGLALSRMIVERHGGQLSALPAQPRGSIFRVVLPTGRLAKANL